MNDEAMLTPTFVDCVIRGDVKNAELYIKEGSIPNAQTTLKGRKYSMVEIAIKNDDIDMIRLLLNKGATIPTYYKAEEYLFSHGLLQVDPSKIIRSPYLYAAEASKNPESQYAKFIFKLLGGSYSSYWCNDNSIEKKYYFRENIDTTRKKEVIDLFIDTEKNNFPVVLKKLENDQTLICAEIWAKKSITLLDCAILNMSREIATYLINHKAKYYLSEDELIAKACESGNLDFLKALDSIGFNFTKDMSNSLSTAIKNGDTEMIDFFIEKKAKLRLCHVVSACENGNVELVRYLLDHGAPLQEGSISALVFPCQNGQLDILKLLLSKGANVNIGKGKLLNSACMGDNIEIVELLLKSGADPNQAPLIGGYPIEIAASVGKIDTIKKLLSYGVELKNKGREAIIAAAANGHINVFNYLADIGVDLKENLGVIMNAACTNGHIEIVKILDELIPEDEFEKIAANVVKVTEHPEIIQFFIDKGLDIITHQLFEQAIHSNHFRVVQFLLGIGLKVKDNDLYLALEYSSYELLELLLKNFKCKDYEVDIKYGYNEEKINLLEKYGMIIVSTNFDVWYNFIHNERYESITRAIVNGFNHESLYKYLGTNCCIPRPIMYSIESFIDPYSEPLSHEIIGAIKLEKSAIMYPILKNLFNDENFWNKNPPIDRNEMKYLIDRIPRFTVSSDEFTSLYHKYAHIFDKYCPIPEYLDRRNYGHYRHYMFDMDMLDMDILDEDYSS